MDHYLDIRVLSDPEFNTQQLMDALFAKLHRVLTGIGDGRIGISFPQADRTPGNTLRVHGTAVLLHALLASNWLQGLRDYCEIRDCLPVPEGIKHRCIRRVQVKSNIERLRRRSIKKGWLSEAQAIAQITAKQQQRTDLPYLQMKSLSNEQRYLLFFELGPLLDQPIVGTFSSYGFSAGATIPWF